MHFCPTSMLVMHSFMSLVSECCFTHCNMNWECLLCAGAFDDDDVTHVEGEVNPVRDLEIISEELRLKDVQYLTKNIVSCPATEPEGQRLEYLSLSLSSRRQL